MHERLQHNNCLLCSAEGIAYGRNCCMQQKVCKHGPRTEMARMNREIIPKQK